MKTWIALGVISIASPAAAQEVESPPFPALATTDHVSDHSFIHDSLAFSSYDDAGPDLGMRIDLCAAYLMPRGYGLYGQLAFSHVDAGDQAANASGNVELGGLWVVPHGARTDIVVRGGLTLPTGGSAVDSDLGYATIDTLIPRLTEYAQMMPGVTAMRLSASPLYQDGALFLRGDVGLDVALDTPDGVDVDPLMRANVALGFRTGRATFAGELATLGTTGHVDEFDDRFLHTLAVSAGYTHRSLRGYGAVIVPVGNELADFLGVDFAVMFGMEWVIRPFPRR